MKHKTMEEDLKAFSLIKSIEVQWGDMDAAQHVNNLIYLRWGETARVAYFYKMGEKVTPTDGSIGFILAYQDCKYIFPITFPDTAVVGVKVVEVQKDRFDFVCHVYSEKHQRIAAISKQTVVTFDYKKQKKVEVTAQMLEAIKAIEGYNLSIKSST